MLSLKSAVRTRRITFFAVRLAVLGGIALVLGFATFLWLLPSQEVALAGNADGVVVLTGGTSRVSDALELLAAGRGKRLLITGVNPGTTTADIARQVPSYGRLLSCCVDLDYSAINTLGNALETRHWALDRSFRSLIVVTSAYHMPRALAEIAHQLPDVALIPYPVVSDRLRVEPWWANGSTTRLVLSEYFKFLFAKVRMRFDFVTAETGGHRLSATGAVVSAVRAQLRMTAIQ
ncbi:MAG: YdcF family protein [Xanthobacteraceae bacterium]|nr:YdcF family protein [Xanthobacteraceae bacterium]